MHDALTSPGGPGRIENRSPADLRPLRSVTITTDLEVREIVDRARSAQPYWEHIGFEKRAHLLKLASTRMLERRQEVLELLYDEAGKTLGDMLLSEAVGPLQFIKDWIKVARPFLKTRKLPISPLAFPGKKGKVEMLPRGVIGVISPWNFPLGNFFKPVFAALLCGNSVVIKPSEFSPLTAEWFVKILQEFLPTDVLGLIQGDRHQGQALLRAGIDAVTFTGSYASGREVAKMAAEAMIPCSVELGGKDAAIVLSDCNLDRTVAGVMNWGLQNAGQACGDIDRVYVEESFADRFASHLAEAVARLRFQTPENQSRGFSRTRPYDVGPVINANQLSIIQSHVEDAVSKGAKILCGGKPTGAGYGFEPTVLDHCTHAMKVMREPTFGPVIPIMRFNTQTEAVQLANDCDYGLNASVWSENLVQAEKLAKKLEAGTVYVNNHAFSGAIPSAPWTGVKHSGHGIANSVFALQHYTRPRTVIVDRKKSPDAWWLPMDELAQKMGQCLAEAQLNALSRTFSMLRAAIQLPWILAQRQKRILKFVRGEYVDESALRQNSNQNLLTPLLTPLRWIAQRAIPVTRRELRWGASTIEAIFHEASPSGDSGTPFISVLPRGETEAFLKDLYLSMPFPSNWAMRLNFWAVGLAPGFILKKWTFVDRLSVEDRLTLIQAFYQSESYLLRQIAILLKMNGSLSQLSTTRFRQATRQSSLQAEQKAKITQVQGFHL
jgi:acyl-CoA reductase-like NAD-dependent aldehyde dehydrogenase